MAVCVRRGHRGAAVIGDIGFQGILDSGGVAGQRVLEAGDECVGTVIIGGHAVVRLIRGGIAVIGADADGGEESGIRGVIHDAVQKLRALHVVVRHGNAFQAGHLEIGVHNALNGVPV